MGMTLQDAVRNQQTRYWEDMRHGPQPTKLIIDGHAQHGKDTVGDLLAEHMNFTKLNASMFFAERYMIPAFPDRWSCVEHAYLERGNHRSLWYEMMRMYPWQEEFMRVSDVFCGHRNIQEFEDMVAMLPHARSIWVEDPRKPLEDPSSMQFQDLQAARDMHDIVILNDGDLTALEDVCKALVEEDLT